MRRHALALLAAFAAGPSVAQDKKPDPPGPPAIFFPIPLVPGPGPKVKLTLRGAKLDAVKEVTTSDPAVKAKVLTARKANVPTSRAKEREGDTEVEVELELPAGLKPGLTLTAVGPAGASKPYPLPTPGDLPAVAEKEPNDGFRDAQPVPFPAAVAATVKSDKDADVFRFDGKAGQAVRIEVEATRLGSPVDAILTLYDADRRVLATADDTPETGADPVLTVTLPRDGVFYVGVIDANDLGGGHYGYRLILRPAK